MKLKSAIEHHIALTAMVLIVIAVISYIGVVWWSFAAFHAYKDRELLKYPESIRPWMDIWYDSTIYSRIADYATVALPFVIVAIIIVCRYISERNAPQNEG